MFYESNVMIIYNFLEVMRNFDVEYFVFMSFLMVYGDVEVILIFESYGFFKLISVYGGVKFVVEVIISGYVYIFGFKVLSFCLVNIIGKCLNYGVIYDFINKLWKNLNELEIFGDGI